MPYPGSYLFSGNGSTNDSVVDDTSDLNDPLDIFGT